MICIAKQKHRVYACCTQCWKYISKTNQFGFNPEDVWF